MTDAVRIDKWLWAVRVFKTRTLAAHACQAGHVRVNEIVVKPARELRPGDTVTVRGGALTRTFRVVALLENRVGAGVVPSYAEDLTPPEEIQRAKDAARQAALHREPGAGRPTKRDRRLIEAFLELPPPDIS